MPAFEKAFEHSRRLGIDECEISAVTKKITTVRITDSEIAELKQNLEKSFGVRAISQKKIASYQTNDEDGVCKAIEGLLLRAPAARERGFWKSLPHKVGRAGPLEGTFDRKLDGISGAEAADIAQEMINSALDGRISDISGSLNIVSERFEISNSNGLFGSDKATYISGMVNSESESGGMQVSGLGQECCRTLGKFPAGKIGRDSKDMCLESINPKRCEGGRQTLILEPYSVGELLAFVVFPNFHLKLFSEGKSCFADQLGRQVAAGGCSLVDDPHIPQGIGTKPFDDEGVETKENKLISNGVFQNVFSNLYEGFKEGRKSTGNAARAGLPMGRGADPVPGAMPHNLHVMPGDMSQEEMIRETKHGLLVGRLWYTYALNPIRGDFSCTARSGIRVIKDGRVTDPGKPVRIIHSLPTLLQNISGIGKNEKNVLQWASVPSVTPSIRVEDVPAVPI